MFFGRVDISQRFSTWLFCVCFLLYYPISLKSETIQQGKGTEFVDTELKRAGALIDKDLLAAEKAARENLELAREIGYEKGEDNTLYQLAFILSSQARLDTCLAMANAVLDEKGEDFELRGHWLILRAIVYKELGKLDSALIDYDAVKEAKQSRDYEKMIAYANFNKGIIESKMGNLTKAIDHYLSAVPLFREQGLARDLANSFHNIGDLLIELKQDREALEYFRKAIEINTAENHQYHLAKNYSDLGIAYKNLDSLNLADYFYNEAMTIGQKLNSPRIVAGCLVNKGELRQKQKNYEEAYTLLDSSINLSREYGYAYIEFDGLLNLGRNYRLTNDVDSSLSVLKKAEALGIAHRFTSDMGRVYEEMAKTYLLMDDNENLPYKYLQKYHATNDSIVGEQQQMYILNLKEKYEAEIKDHQILLLEKSRLRLWVVLFGIIIISLTLFILFLRIWYQRQKAMRNRLLEQERNTYLNNLIEIKETELMTQASQLIKMQKQRDGILKEIIATLEQNLGKDSSLKKKIQSMVGREKHQSNVFDEFEKRLEENNTEFYNKILKQFPSLTPAELKICALLRMNISTKEIAQLVNRSTRTIENTRNNIRKKLGLSSKDNLTSFLLKVV